MTVFKQFAETFKNDPVRLAAIQMKLVVCEAAVHRSTLFEARFPPVLIQHLIVADCPKGNALVYSPDEVVVEGTLKIEEKGDHGYTVSIFSLDVTSVIVK